MNRKRDVSIGVVGLTLLFFGFLGCAENTQEFIQGESIRNSSNPKAPAIDGQYIVVLKKTNVQAVALQQLGTRTHSLAIVQNVLGGVASRHKIGPPEIVFSKVIQGGVYHLDKNQVEELAADPRVAYIEQDRIVQISASQSNATWGLDRIDQLTLPLNQTFQYPEAGVPVNAYVIDTGILTTHQEFQGRASSGIDIVDRDNDATDCNGHGTHVAGTIGSLNYGVAKRAKLIGVRVLDCNGSGSFSGVIAGIEWVTTNHVKPAVANMSLGGGVSQAVDDAVAASIQAGVTYVVAAGNENVSACNSSPARLSAAITVGATTSTDARSSFSNFGACVDIFAPGTDIKSTWIDSVSSSHTISGTSMASPHVAGAAAIYLSYHPSATPDQVRSALVSQATSGKISGVGSGSPNLLLNITSLADSGGDSPPPPPVEDVLRLQNNVSLNDLQGIKGQEKVMLLSVPQGASQLMINVSGGQGDLDLYVRFGSKPTLTAFDCRPYQSGNSETCSWEAPQAGDYYIVLRAYADYSGASTKASYQTSNPTSPCAGCRLEAGELKNTGASVYAPTANGVSLKAGLQHYELIGPPLADFDLYLYKKSGNSWKQVASATGRTSQEQISYQGAAGTYRLKVNSHSGAGKFDLWRKVP